MPPYILLLVLIFPNNQATTVASKYQSEASCQLDRARLIKKIDEYNASKDPERQIVAYASACEVPVIADRGVKG